jgi:hypothetical protein
MKTPHYFANLLSAPPGIAPLRVPYAPFGDSRTLPGDTGVPDRADRNGDPAPTAPASMRAERRTPAPHDLPAARDVAAESPAQAAAVAPTPAPPRAPAQAHAALPAADWPPAAMPAASEPGAPHEQPTPRARNVAARAVGEWQVTEPVRHTARSAATSARTPAGAPRSVRAPGDTTLAAPAPDVPADASYAPLPLPHRDAPPPSPQREPAERQASPAAPVEIDIDHIEVRVLPPAPAPRKESASGRPAGPLLRVAPPFGLRQS